MKGLRSKLETETENSLDAGCFAMKAISANSAAEAEWLSLASQWNKSNPWKILGFQIKKQAMLSRPATSNRQLIGLCLSENIEFNSHQEALTRASPSWVGEGHLPRVHKDRRTCHSCLLSTLPPGPLILPGRRKLFNSGACSGRRERWQERAGIWFFF
jgi:hypothetical protein